MIPSLITSLILAMSAFLGIRWTRRWETDKGLVWLLLVLGSFILIFIVVLVFICMTLNAAKSDAITETYEIDSFAIPTQESSRYKFVVDGKEYSLLKKAVDIKIDPEQEEPILIIHGYHNPILDWEVVDYEIVAPASWNWLDGV